MFARRSILAALFVVGLVTLPVSQAFAHHGPPGHDFMHGWMHPLTGLDHFLAMVAVGLLAVRTGGNALWLMPLSFLASMLLGGLAAAMGIPLPGVEYGIMASVLVLGLLVASTKIAPLGVGMALVALFAFFHGHAHAEEMVSGGSLSAYAAGFLASTAVLHAGGIVAGLAVMRMLNTQTLRWAGTAIAACGALMFVNLL